MTPKDRGDMNSTRFGAIRHKRLTQFAVQLGQLTVHRRGDGNHVAGLRNGGVAAFG